MMLFCLLVIERNVRKIGRAGLESLTGYIARRRAQGDVRRRRAALARALAARRRHVLTGGRA